MAATTAAVVALAAAGCGPRNSYALEDVAGTVRYEDGSLIPGEILIRFEPLVDPLSERIHPKAGMAMVDPATGQFANVTTYKYGDGIIRGRHKVLLTARRAAEDKPLVPENYHSSETTPLEVDSSESPFELTVPKP